MIDRLYMSKLRNGRGEGLMGMNHQQCHTLQLAGSGRRSGRVASCQTWLLLGENKCSSKG